MSSENHTTNIAEEVPGDKGKGKAAEPVAQDTAMDEDDDSSSSDEGEEVSFKPAPRVNALCLRQPADHLCPAQNNEPRKTT